MPRCFPPLALLALLLLSPACQPTANPASAEPTTNEGQSLLDGQLLLQAIDSATFAAGPRDSLQHLLIQQFCEESKGYRANVWLGLNQCSWAIEKYRLDHGPQFVQRHGNELNVVLPDGAKRSFIHDLASERATYYQFRHYLPRDSLVCIEKIRESACPQLLLVQQRTGTERILDGTSFWSPRADAFLLQCIAPGCGERLEHWSVTGGSVERDWSIDFPANLLREVKWLDRGEWLLAEAGQFRRLKWLER